MGTDSKIFALDSDTPVTWTATTTTGGLKKSNESSSSIGFCLILDGKDWQ